MFLDIGITTDLSLVPNRVTELATAGFDGVFTAESNRDVFAPLVLAAEHSDLYCYTNIALAFPRSPMLLACTGWDLQNYSQGKMALGLGSQIKPHIQKRYSATWEHPVRQMREVIESIKAIFKCWSEGSELNYQGEFYKFSLMTPIFVPDSMPWKPPPVWLAALGPMMTNLAGEISDGVLIHPFSSRKFLDEVTIPALTDGAEKSGRKDKPKLITNSIVCSYRSDEEYEKAIKGAKFNLAFYGSTPAYKVTLDVHGWGDMQPVLNRLTKEGRWEEISSVITDEVLHTLAVVGEPSEVGSQLVERFGDIADRVGLSVPYDAPVDLLADVVNHVKLNSSKNKKIN